MAFFALLTLLFSSSPAFAIMRGHEVDPASPLAQVAVLLTKTAATMPSNCTGTRISPSLILTAAHCAQDSNFVTFWNQASAPIQQRWVHPQWNAESDEYDVALLEIPAPYPAGPWAELPSNDELIQLGQALTVAGWGYTELGEDAHLHTTSYRAFEHYLDTQISFVGDHTGICGGDSGGGNFVNRKEQLVIAAVSSSTQDEDRYGCDSFVYLVKVSAVKPWILHMMGH